MYAERADKCQSPIELEFLAACCTVGLIVEPQYPVGPIHADFAIPSMKLVIECDGKEFHTGFEASRNDRKRDEIYDQNGWDVLRLTGAAIKKDADGIAWAIKIGKLRGGTIFRAPDDPRMYERMSDEIQYHEPEPSVEEWKPYNVKAIGDILKPKNG